MNDETPDSDQPELLQLSNFLTYRVARLHQKLNAQASRILSNSVGITLNQWRMIAFIGGTKGITASELVKLTALNKGLVSRNVGALIESGLVASTAHRSDNRVNVLTLTVEGKKVFDTALPKMRRRQAKLQNKLSEDDLIALRRMLAVLETAAEDTET